MKEKSGNQNTFIIKIMNDQNMTWQGNITWLAENETRSFRSALELIKMIDSVLAIKEADEEI